MMITKRCIICKKSSDIIELYEGLYDDEMVMICENCSNEEKIPLLRKPSREQLVEVDRRDSVRERMERISGMNKRRTLLSKDQMTVQRNLNRLRMPEPKEQNESVVENYYWEINMARRRKKMTLNQLSVQTGIDLAILEALEKGKLPKDFEQIFVKLEDYFGIKLLKHHKSKVNYLMPELEKEEVLDEVRKKIKTRAADKDEEDEYKEFDKLQKKEKLKELQEGSLKLSNSENLKNITLNDLVRLKKEKEKKEKLEKVRKQTEELLGDDLDLL